MELPDPLAKSKATETALISNLHSPEMSMKTPCFNNSFVAGCIAAASFAASPASAGSDWTAAGRDLSNSRNQPDETRISPASVPSLSVKWAFTSAGDVTANPAVEGDHLYFPDAAGYLYKVDRRSGKLIWKFPVSDYTGIPGDYARATPAIAGDALILGNQTGKNLEIFGAPQPQGAWVFAVDKRTGKALWKTQIDSTKRSMVTHSAIVANGTAYVGVASNEELVAGIVTKAQNQYAPQFGSWVWEFRGSVVALDVKTGAIKWKTYTAPEGYFGASVWGSTGAVDLKRRQLYMATGDNFWEPEAVQACVAAAQAKQQDPSSCQAKDAYFDSIIAFDLDTGKVNWAKRGMSYDTWNVGCGLFVPGFTIPPNDNCPNPKGPDWDFAQGPMLIGDDDDAIVGAGQKSGMFWAFKARNGELAWRTQVAPGGLTGGLQWGSAYDGKRIYVASSNAGPVLGSGQDAQPWKLKDGSSTTAGGWAALDPKTGKLIWTTADPLGGRAEGAVSVANGVMFGCNLEYNPSNPALGAGHYYALNAATGKPIWSSPTTGACAAGPSISKGMVYWGSGTFRGTTPNKVFGFGLPAAYGDD
jgi:polyvinyl alcohol dehydrogenase (cytochrome)